MNYLVIANQTLGGRELMEAIRERAASGSAHFHVLVPNTAPADFAPAASAGGASAGAGAGVGAGVGAPRADQRGGDDEATRRARRRLREMLERINEVGGEADGELGDANPVKAVREVLRHGQFDEVIVSTLPSGVSRWVRLDVPSRIKRTFDGPVTVIETKI